MTTRRSALTAAHIAAVLFGLSGIFGALIQAGPGLITFGRALFAVAALAAFSLWRRRPLRGAMGARQMAVLVLAGMLLAAHWVTFFISIKIGGVAVATLGFASFPAFIALLDMLVVRERIGAGEGTLLGLVTLGLVLVTPSFDFGDQGTIGLLWGLASGFSFALLAIANRRAAHGIDAIQVAFWQNATVALVMLPFAAGGLAALGPLDWLNLALLGVFCTGLSHYLFVMALGALSARSTGMIIALEPVYAIACAWWLFAEQPSARMLAGAALIILAILVSARGKASAPPPAPAD